MRLARAGWRDAIAAPGVAGDILRRAGDGNHQRRGDNPGQGWTLAVGVAAAMAAKAKAPPAIASIAARSQPRRRPPGRVMASTAGARKFLGSTVAGQKAKQADSPRIVTNIGKVYFQDITGNNLQRQATNKAKHNNTKP